LEKELKNIEEENEKFSAEYVIEGLKECKRDNYDKGLDYLKIATEFNIENHNAFYDWGNSLKIFAETKKEQEVKTFFDRYFDRYKELAKTKTLDYKALNNWGVALAILAEKRIKDNKKKGEDLFNEAFERYVKAEELEPNNPELLNNYGTGLGDLAKIKFFAGESMDKIEILLNLATEKCQKAVDLGGKPYGLDSCYGLSLLIAENTEEAKKNAGKNEKYVFIQ
jgi:tetratricopeptide (TPR) repeat protein